MITKKHISQLKKVAKQKSIYIIDKTVLIDSDYLTSTDLITFIRIPHDYTVNGRGVIPIEILESVFDNVESINFEDTKCTIKLKTGGALNVDCLSAYDFPLSHEIKLSNEIHYIDGAKLLSVVDFVSKDDLRPALRGVFLGKHIVATNCHYLKWIESGYSGSDIVIPGFAVKLLDKTTYLMKHDNEHVIFTEKTTGRGSFIVTKLINERYPNYLQVIPKDNPGLITVNKKDLQSALKQLKPIAPKTTKKVVFTSVDNDLNIYAENIDFGTSLNVPIKATTKNVESGYKISFNLSYLETVASNVTSDTITFNFAETNSRAGIINADTLLMPMVLEV